MESKRIEINSNIVSYKVLTKDTEPKNEDIEVKIIEVPEHYIKIERPKQLDGTTYKIKSPLTKSAIYVTINNKEDKHGNMRPFEIFLYSKDSTHYEWSTALTRMLSAVFRRGGDFTYILEELECIITPGSVGYIARGGKHIPSLVAEISMFALRPHFVSLGMVEDQEKKDPNLQEYLTKKNEEYIKTSGDKEDAHTGYPKGAVICPKCNTKAMIPMDNCMTCLSCGDSKCG
jgi:hypothetical protein